MNDLQKMLRDYADKQSKFFKLLNGQEKIVRYLRAEVVPNHFDNGKTQCVRFHLESEGKIKLWDRTSMRLSLQMSNIPEGSLIKIKRTGDLGNSKYFIERIKE